MKRLRLGVYFLLLLTLVACQQRGENDAAAEQSEPVAVELIRVASQTMPMFEPVVGTVRARHEATVSADMSGRILALTVDRGQQVQKGDIIARIDAAELEASLMRAEATLKRAESELARQKTLLASNVTSKARYEQAEAEEHVSRANLTLIKATLAKALVLAPFSGTITNKMVDTGDLAAPGRALVSMENPLSLRLEAPVAESLAGNLKEGQTLHLQIDSANLTIDCKISELAPSADYASRTFLVKIDLPRTENIKSGAFGRVWIPRGKAEILLIPASAVVMRGQMEVVFIKSGDAARLRLVRTVPHGENQRSVLSGLSDGDQVIINPEASLRDGAPLTIK